MNRIMLTVHSPHSASWKHSFIFDFIHILYLRVVAKSISWLKKLEENYAIELSGAARETTAGLCARLKKLVKTPQNS